MSLKPMLVAGLFCTAALAAAGAARAQIGRVPPGQLDPNRAMAQMRDPARRAADAYARAARTRHKAEEAKDPQERLKLLARAKDELNRSIDIQPSFDALLALGQVNLALGSPGPAHIACSQAQDLRPGDPAVKACLDEAEKPAAAPAPGAASASPPPPPPPPPPNR
jgi:hypothetical protein